MRGSRCHHLSPKCKSRFPSNIRPRSRTVRIESTKFHLDLETSRTSLMSKGAVKHQVLIDTKATRRHPSHIRAGSTIPHRKMDSTTSMINMKKYATKAWSSIFTSVKVKVPAPMSIKITFISP